MKIIELIEKNKGKFFDVEIYGYTTEYSASPKLLSRKYSPETSWLAFSKCEVKDYKLMDEKEYYIFSGNSEPFLNIYGKSDAKVLTIFLADDWEKDKMTPHDLYDKRNTKYISLKLNRNTDADILHWLEMQDSKQGAIKRIIREKINKEGNQKDE